MAQVSPEVRQTIDEWLEYLTDAWRQLPKAAREIDQWDFLQQIDYIEEWAPKEELAIRLRHWITLPEATEPQRARYRELEQLVRDNRPILDRMRTG